MEEEEGPLVEDEAPSVEESPTEGAAEVMIAEEAGDTIEIETALEDQYQSKKARNWM